MKTHLKILLFLMALSTVSPIITAQISLEKTYTNSVYYTKLSEGEEKIFLMDVPLGQCRIYNLDHSLYRTINIALDQNYYLYDISYVSRNLFNDDNEIELLYLANRYFQNATPPYYQYSLGVVNESGASLLKVDLGTYYEIQNVDGQNKLLVWLYDNSLYPYFKGTNIYSLKQGATGAPMRKSTATYDPAYPNPASDQITIPLNLPGSSKKAFVQILSSDGALLKEYKVDNFFSELLPDISDLKPGIYFYNIMTEAREILHSDKFSINR
jgi:hypothetical protein